MDLKNGGRPKSFSYRQQNYKTTQRRKLPGQKRRSFTMKEKIEIRRLYIDRGFTVPEIVELTKDTYKFAQGSLEAFIRRHREEGFRKRNYQYHTRAA